MNRFDLFKDLDSLRLIHCKFFKRGEGLCPFGSKCFYLHVDKHGQSVELGPPRRRQRINARGELENFSDVFMVSVFGDENLDRFFDEYVLWGFRISSDLVRLL